MTGRVEPELVLQGGAPMHWQIYDQVGRYIRAGVLRPGEQLPTVRAVAVGLAVNPAVVEKAYAALERDGLVTSSEGSGIFVAGVGQDSDPADVPLLSQERR